MLVNSVDMFVSNCNNFTEALNSMIIRIIIDFKEKWNSKW